MSPTDGEPEAADAAGSACQLATARRQRALARRQQRGQAQPERREACRLGNIDPSLLQVGAPDRRGLDAGTASDAAADYAFDPGIIRRHVRPAADIAEISVWDAVA